MASGQPCTEFSSTSAVDFLALRSGWALSCSSIKQGWGESGFGEGTCGVGVREPLPSWLLCPSCARWQCKGHLGGMVRPFQTTPR